MVWLQPNLLKVAHSYELRYCLPCSYTEKQLTRKLTVQAVETRAWAVLSVDMLPKVCKGSHVFHAWLGCARVIETSEVRGLWGKLTDRISRMHVRRSPAIGGAQL